MKRIILTITAVALFCSVESKADSITYSLTTTASGTLGTTPFTNALITMTLVGDTSNIFAGNLIGGSAYVGTLGEFGSGTVIISGIGAATLSDPAFILSTFTNTSVFGGSGVCHWGRYQRYRYSGCNRPRLVWIQSPKHGAGDRSRRFREWWGITPSFLQCFPHVAWCPFITSARASPHGKL